MVEGNPVESNARYLLIMQSSILDESLERNDPENL